MFGESVSVDLVINTPTVSILTDAVSAVLPGHQLSPESTLRDTTCHKGHVGESVVRTGEADKEKEENLLKIVSAVAESSTDPQ
jgi:hypothetical protein